MIRNIALETLKTFRNATAPQLQTMTSNFRDYCENPEQQLADIRSATHRLKGEASMIGLSDFAHVAAFQEELIEELEQDSNQASHTIAFIGQSIEALDYYVANLLEEAEEQEKLFETIVAFRRLRGLPEDQDDAEVERLLGWGDADEANAETDAAATNASPSNALSSVDPVQLDLFQEEVADHLRKVSGLLGEDRDLDPDEVQDIRRAVHSIKGGASAIGFQQTADLAHAIEDLVDRIEQNDDSGLTGENRELLTSAIDVLGELVEEGPESVDIADLVKLLNGMVGGQATATQKKPAFDSSTIAIAEPTPQDAEAIAQAALEELKADLANEVPGELYEIYREEAEDHVKLIYSGLNALKTTPDDREQLQSVRRSAHTLKGAAGAVGVRVVTKLSHRMEDLLDWLYNNNEPMTSERLTLLLDTTDRLHDVSFGEFDKEEIAASVADIYARYTEELGAANVSVPTTEPVKHSDAQANPLEINFDPTATIEDAAVESKTTKKAESKSGDQRQMLRVPLSRIDDLVRTVSELIINRTTFEQRMADFVGGVDELAAILDRLRSVSTEMETRYSVDALGGNSPLFRSSDGQISQFGRVPTTPNSPQTNQSRMSEFDSLEFDQYNEFHLLTRTVGEVSNDVNTVTNELRTLIGDFDSLLARQDRLSRDTQDRLMKVRMVPLATLATRLHRAVRVVASNQNKQVELIIEGEETEIDKTVLEEIADPLLHLMRNAVDHGVEPTDLRVVKGKPELATIRLKAFYQGTQVVVRISDDGGGLDPTRIADAAVRKGYLNKTEVADMTPQEIFPYIFIPGLSTASEVSEVSGRGVGMDIVRDKVQKLKGTITVDSEKDKGTTFTIRLPLTLAVTRALMVTAGNELFAIPMQSVIQIARLERSAIEELGTQPIVHLNGAACPLVRLSDKLSLRELDNDSPTIPVLIVRSGDRELAVRVEKIVAGRDIVVKTLGSHLRKVDGLIGATLLGDGTVVPILDPNALTGGSDSLAAPTGTGRSVHGNRGDIHVMMVDDSVSVRRVMENLVKAQGWSSIVAKDGVDALEVLQAADRKPDIFLLDVEMPRMDGYELLSTLRSQPETMNTPIVMVTSRAGEKHRQKAYSLGASDYLVKPYQDEQLVALVQQLTASRESTLA